MPGLVTYLALSLVIFVAVEVTWQLIKACR